MARLVTSVSEFVNRAAMSVVAARRYSMPDRDFPPGGRQPSSELEEVLAQVRQYWPGFRAGPIIGLGVLIVALIFLWSSWFTVQPEETGIVQRFGKVVRTAEPGLHFKWPFGIDTVRLVPTARVLKEEFGFRTLASAPGQRTQYSGNQPSGSQAYKSESLMLTGDLNVIDVQWIIQYRIEDPIRYLFHVRDTSKTIRDITEAVMRRVVGNRLGSDVLTVGRVAVSTTAKEETQQILTAYDTGVRLVTVELQDVTPPDAVKPAFNEVNEARQDKERTINQAQEQVNREIPKAGGEAARSISEAEGYAIERVNRARGEATRFQAILAEYQQAPEVTRRRLHLEALGRFITEMKGLYIVDRDQKAMVPWIALEAGPKEAGPKPAAEGRSP
jgi:membrane protease subunit HflK